MNILLSSQEPIYLMHELPQDWEVPGNWQLTNEGTWLVPPDFNWDDPAVQSWLAVGNWQLYSAPAPAEGNWPDPARCRAGDLLAWMKTRSVRALIDSFHDDTSWVVAFVTAKPDL
jgi:hypothetical protein